MGMFYFNQLVFVTLRTACNGESLPRRSQSGFLHNLELSSAKLSLRHGGQKCLLFSVRFLFRSCSAAAGEKRRDRWSLFRQNLHTTLMTSSNVPTFRAEICNPNWTTHCSWNLASAFRAFFFLTMLMVATNVRASKRMTAGGSSNKENGWWQRPIRP